ncbi:hypothetical protein G7054_g13743 [Neopestalotiopsis clavispora]|nr:hypothetical protein G7054_g13743 [Neopestalotiopsis clavispora]
MAVSTADFPSGTENHLSMRIGCYVLFGLCTIAVMLRIYVRTIRSRRIGLDDCFILAAWVSEVVVIVCVKLQFESGIGWHAADLAQLPDAAKILSSIVLVGFAAEKKEHQQWWHLSVTPFPSSGKNATEFGGPKCFNILAFNYYNAAFFILSDLFLAISPVLVLKDMQMNRKRKVLLSIMFSLGTLAIGGTVSRQVTNAIAINDPDFSWYWAPAAMCSVIESSLGIIFVCVPAIAPMFSNVIGSTAKKSGQDDIDLDNSKNPGTFGKLGRNPKRRPSLGDETLLCETQLTNIGGHESDMASQKSGCETEVGVKILDAA